MANRDVAAVRRAGARPRGEPATPPLLRSVKAWRVVTLVLVLAAWQLSSGPLVDPLLISSPSDVLGRLAHLLTGGEIWRHIGATYSEVGIGYALAAVIGIGAGVLLGRARFAARVLEPYIMAAYSIPKITLAPLFILWLGIGSQSKIGISFLSAVFLIFYATYTGIRHMDEELVTVARLLGARRFELVARVLLPQAAPFILDGLRAGLPFAVIGAVVGEFMAANVGLGFFIQQSSSNLDATSTFAGIIILVTGVSALNWILAMVESRLLKWKPTAGQRVAST